MPAARAGGGGANKGPEVEALLRRQKFDEAAMKLYPGEEVGGVQCCAQDDGAADPTEQ